MIGFAYFYEEDKNSVNSLAILRNKNLSCVSQCLQWFFAVFICFLFSFMYSGILCKMSLKKGSFGVLVLIKNNNNNSLQVTSMKSKTSGVLRFLCSVRKTRIRFKIYEIRFGHSGLLGGNRL